MISATEIEKKLNKVVDRMMVLKNSGMEEKFPVSLIDIDCWEWPQGVGLFGLYKYYEISKREDVLAFLLRWFDDRLAEGISEKNVNTTAPMLTLTYLYELTGDEAYYKLIEEWVRWIMDDKGLIRTGDDAFQHMITGDANDGEILIDTIFMTLLFLARAGKILGRPDCIDEANYQILIHIKCLFDKKKGLFYHGFNFDFNHNYGEVYWNRGNSWYTSGIMEYLNEHTIDAGIKRYLLNVYEDQVKAYQKYVDPTQGLWHTVIDDPTSYIETSGSAGVLFGMMQGVRLGILKGGEYRELIEKAMENILKYIDSDGTVLNVSYGTPIGDSAEFYKEIPICPMTYGQALMILTLQEAMQSYWHET